MIQILTLTMETMGSYTKKCWYIC